MKSQPIRSLLVLSLLLLTSSVTGQEAKHLFILSGQSNMQGHRPDEAFTPAVQEALGTELVIVIQERVNPVGREGGTGQGRVQKSKTAHHDMH